MLNITKEEALSLIPEEGIGAIQPFNGGKAYIFSTKDDLRRLIFSCVKVVIEPKRKEPSGFQVVGYGRKDTTLFFLDIMAINAERRLKGLDDIVVELIKKKTRKKRISKQVLPEVIIQKLIDIDPVEQTKIKSEQRSLKSRLMDKLKNRQNI